MERLSRQGVAISAPGLLRILVVNVTAQSRPGSLAYAVLDAIAERESTDIDELPPLHETIDPEALDQLFAQKRDGTPRGGGRVQFSYDGYVVTVHSDETVELQVREK